MLGLKIFSGFYLLRIVSFLFSAKFRRNSIVMSGENLHQSVSQSVSQSVGHSVNSGGGVVQISNMLLKCHSCKVLIKIT